MICKKACKTIFIFPLEVLLTFWMAFHTLLCSAFLIVILFLRLPRTWVIFFIQVLWAQVLLKTLFIKVDWETVEGVVPSTGGNKTNDSEGMVYLFNHVSLLDIPIIVSRYGHLYFAAKKELFAIPIFGWALSLYGVLKINRENRGRTLNMYKEVAQVRIGDGDSFILSPEGGRGEGASGALRPFKLGPFLLATIAKADIQPILIFKADHFLSKKSLFFSFNPHKRVSCKVLPRVFREQVIKKLEEKDEDQAVDEAKKLRAHVAQIMNIEYNKEMGVI